MDATIDALLTELKKLCTVTNYVLSLRSSLSVSEDTINAMFLLIYSMEFHTSFLLPLSLLRLLHTFSSHEGKPFFPFTVRAIEIPFFNILK